MKDPGFEQILEEFHPMLRAAVSRNYLNCQRYEVDPADVYQEACLALWTAYCARPRADSVFYAVAHRAVRQTIRHAIFYASQRRGHRPYNPDRAYVKYWLPDSWALYLTTRADFTAVEVEEFVSSCPEGHQRVVNLATQGYSLPEIALMLGVGRRTIERRMEEIRALYRAWCGEFSGEVNDDERTKTHESAQAPERTGLRPAISGRSAHARRQNHTRAVSNLPGRRARG